MASLHLCIFFSLTLVVWCGNYEVFRDTASDFCLVLTVPYGGNSSLIDTEYTHVGCYIDKKCDWLATCESPAEDRCNPDLAKEKYTERMVREFHREVQHRVGKYPKLIIREAVSSPAGRAGSGGSGEDGSGEATAADWSGYDEAIEQIVNHDCDGLRGLLLDFIAHEMENPIITLGYLLPSEDILNDESSELSELTDKSSIRALANNIDKPFADLVRGFASLGHYLNREDLKAAPSPDNTLPDTPYITGGYTVQKYGSRDSFKQMDAIQVTIPKSLMKGSSRRKSLAKKFVNAVVEFMKDTHYI